MSEAMANVLAAALKLPPNERGELIAQLADSLDPPEGVVGVSEAEFAAELARRAADMRSDPTAGIPWDDVKGMR